MILHRQCGKIMSWTGRRSLVHSTSYCWCTIHVHKCDQPRVVLCIGVYSQRVSSELLSVFQSGMALITKLWRVFSLIRGSFRHLSFPANFPFSIPAYPKRPIYNKDLVTSSQCIAFGMRDRPGSRPGPPSDIQRPANTRSVAGSVATASGRPSRRTTSSVLPVPAFAAWA